MTMTIKLSMETGADVVSVTEAKNTDGLRTALRVVTEWIIIEINSLSLLWLEAIKSSLETSLASSMCWVWRCEG